MLGTDGYWHASLLLFPQSFFENLSLHFLCKSESYLLKPMADLQIQQMEPVHWLYCWGERHRDTGVSGSYNTACDFNFKLWASLPFLGEPWGQRQLSQSIIAFPAPSPNAYHAWDLVGIWKVCEIWVEWFLFWLLDPHPRIRKVLVSDWVILR